MMSVLVVSWVCLCLYLWVPARYLFPYLDDDEY